jgi:hypothetical protein
VVRGAYSIIEGKELLVVAAGAVVLGRWRSSAGERQLERSRGRPNRRRSLPSMRPFEPHKAFTDGLHPAA